MTSQQGVRPRVTIVCLAYNQAATIGAALESFVAQRCPFPYEVLVHDDASCDRTPQIIADYAARYPQIRPLYSRENQYAKKGLFGLYAEVIGQARGDYIAYCEGDDLFSHPEKLARQAAILDQDTRCGLVFTGFQRLRRGRLSRFRLGGVDTSGDFFARMLVQNVVVAATMMFRRQALLPVMEEHAMAARSQGWKTADYPMLLGVTHRWGAAYIDEPMAILRQNAASLSSACGGKRYVDFLESILQIKEHFCRFANVGASLREAAIGRSIFEIYRYCARHKVPGCARWREAYRAHCDGVKGYPILGLCARYPWLERFYR